MRNGTRGARFLLLAALAAVGGGSSAGDDEGEALNRSFYVPLELDLCDHLRDTLLYRDDTPIARLPGTHVFQFTFYPALGRLEPELDRVRVEGTHDGEPFRMEIVVTPSSVYVGSKKVDLETEKLLARLRRTLDARHETVKLTLRCEHGCGRARNRTSETND